MKKTKIKVVAVATDAMDAGPVFEEFMNDALSEITETGGHLLAVNYLTVTDFFSAAITYEIVVNKTAAGITLLKN
jgi:hypothetical protein